MKNTSKKAPKGKGKAQKKLDDEAPVDDWEVKGWLNTTRNGQVITVKLLDDPDDPESDSTLLGFVRVTTLKKLVYGDIQGVPMKLPPNFDPDE